jgi:hypothetical protein
MQAKSKKGNNSLRQYSRGENHSPANLSSTQSAIRKDALQESPVSTTVKASRIMQGILPYERMRQFKAAEEKAKKWIGFKG